MRYVLLFGENRERQQAFEAMAPDRQQAAMAGVERWFQDHMGKVRGGYQLQPERTATTVRFDSGKPTVIDGPFIEAKEIIGGYAEIEVADLDEAIAMAKEWPTGGPVEIRPVIDRGEGSP